MTDRIPAGLVRGMVLAAGLVSCVVAVFLVVEGLAEVTGGRAGTWAWLGGAAMLALLVPLVRPRLERLADRAAFGSHGDPHAVLATFVQRISDTLAVDDVLPHLARTAVQATRSSSGGVRLWLADGAELHETWPPGAPETTVGDVSLVLEHAGERVGRLEVVGADDELREVDRALLNRLAGPAGLAVSNVRLSLELRRRLAQTTALAEQLRLSRMRLLGAGRDQRERFVLAVQGRVLTRLDAVDEHLLVAAGAAASPTLGAAEQETRACLDALRDLAAGVFPPALSERGVGAALDMHLDQGGGQVRLRDGVGPDVRYPEEVESAAYFCCVALVDDLAERAAVSVDLAGDGTHLSFHARASASLSPQVEELVRDRVEALGGDLVISILGLPVDGLADGAASDALPADDPALDGPGFQGCFVDVQGQLPIDGATLPAVLARLDSASAQLARAGGEPS